MIYKFYNNKLKREVYFMFSFFYKQKDILDKAIRLKCEGKYQESIKCYIEYVQKILHRVT